MSLKTFFMYGASVPKDKEYQYSPYKPFCLRYAYSRDRLEHPLLHQEIIWQRSTKSREEGFSHLENYDHAGHDKGKSSTRSRDY